MVSDLAKLLKKALKFLTHIGVAAVAGVTTTEVPVFKAPCSGRVTRLGFVPKAAITGANTNYMTLGFKDKGSGGTGTDVMASRAYTLGVNVAAFDYEDLGDVSYRDLAKDDVLSFYKAVTGTGMDMPDLVPVVEFQPDLKHGD